MNKAIKNDIEKKYIEAVELYEEEIVIETSPDVNCFINLAFLYWSFAAEQIEFNDPNEIGEEWSAIGGAKFLSTLDKGLAHHPDHLELIFWRRYFLYRLYMVSFSEHDCLELLKYGKDFSLVPYFFLYLFDKKSHIHQMSKLRKTCIDLPTAKNIYIGSFIDG